MTPINPATPTISSWRHNQERLWNSHLPSIQTLATSLRDKLEPLKQNTIYDPRDDVVKDQLASVESSFNTFLTRLTKPPFNLDANFVGGQVWQLSAYREADCIASEITGRVEDGLDGVMSAGAGSRRRQVLPMSRKRAKRIANGVKGVKGATVLEEEVDEKTEEKREKKSVKKEKIEKTKKERNDDVTLDKTKLSRVKQRDQDRANDKRRSSGLSSCHKVKSDKRTRRRSRSRSDDDDHGGLREMSD